MENEKRMKEIAKRFKELQTDNKIISTKQRTTTDNNIHIQHAREILRQHLKDNKTIVPISFKEYDDVFNVSKTSVNHYIDKMVRLFEVALIVEYEKEDLNNFENKQFPYGKRNTELIRQHIDRGHNIKLTKNSEDNTEIFLEINADNL